MGIMDRLYRKEGSVVKTIQIDEELYVQLQKLAEETFDARVSKIINVAIEHYLIKKDYQIYTKSNKNNYVYRALYIRKPFYEELEKIKQIKGIAIYRTINSAIASFLEDYKEELK